MSTDYNLFHSLKPGQLGALKTKTLRVPLEEGAGGGMAAFLLGQMFNKSTFPLVGGGMPYVAGQWGVTTTGTGAAAAQSTAGGILLTAGSSSTFNTNLESVRAWTPVAAKLITFLARIKVSDITAVGFSIGFGNSQADPHTTDYTDGIVFKKAANAATVTGRVRGNSGTAAPTGTLGTMVNDTEVELGFAAMLGASAAACSGFWTYDGVVTPFTANQLTQLAAILTTPPSMYMNLSAKGSSGNPTVNVTSALGQIDN